MSKIMYTLEMTKRGELEVTETSEHISESETFLEASRKLTQASGAGFMMYQSAMCKGGHSNVVLWEIKVM